MQQKNRGTSAALRLAAGIVLLCSGPVFAQINLEAYRDYFLVGQYGEVCTMCEVVVLCETGDAPPEHSLVPEQGSFTLYHLETRSFWSQIATIWEWFINNFRSEQLAARGHTRPAMVYTVSNGAWADVEVIEARLVLDPGVVELGDRTINRVNRQWLISASSQPLGYCQRLPLWESLDAIQAHTGDGQ
jgi:hypothetical protein